LKEAKGNHTEVKGLAGLDIGCGEGHNTRLLAHRGATVTAVDIAAGLIAYAQQAEAAEPLGIAYRVASAVAFSFPDATFRVFKPGPTYGLRRPV